MIWLHKFVMLTNRKWLLLELCSMCRYTINFTIMTVLLQLSKRFTPTWIKAEVSGLLFDWHLVEQWCTRRSHVLHSLLIVTGIHHFLFESLGRHWHQRLWHLALIWGTAMSGKMATGLRGVRCLTAAIGLREWQTGLGKLPMKPNERQKMRNCVRGHYSRATEIMSFA